MPPDTLWTGNPNLKTSVIAGNLAFNNANTLFNSSTELFNGATIANLINIYTPNDTLWTEPNPL